jgi:hypothetical protein
MRLRLGDADERIELLGHLRVSGCVAYVLGDLETIEALLPRAGTHDGAAITSLVDDWRARRTRDRRASRRGY